MPTTIILADYIGRLGNRLCLFIHVLAAAMEHQFHVVNLTLLPHADWFEELSRNSWCRYPAPASGWRLHRWTRGTRTMIEWLAHQQIRRGTAGWLGINTVALGNGERFSMSNPEFLKICGQYRWVILWGWLFRADSYLERHQEAIRSFLRLKKGLDPELEDALEVGRRENAWQIALHIRQGDFRTWEGGRHYIPPEVFAHHARRICEANPTKKICFWICSDESVDLGQFPPGTQTSKGQTLREDLRILTSCDFILGGISTLAHVAAFLGKGRIHNLNRLPEPSPNPRDWPEGLSSLTGQS